MIIVELVFLVFIGFAWFYTVRQLKIVEAMISDFEKSIK